MSKDKKNKLYFFKTLKILVISAFLAGMSIVFGKYLAINVGEYLRFGFENTPIILAGIIFGPLVGGVVGAVADLLGCLAVGYAINPLITVGAATIGFVSGLSSIIMDKLFRTPLILRVAIPTVLAHIIGSLIIKTIGMHIYYTIDLSVLFLWRALNYVIIAPLDTAVIYFLLRSKALQAQINSIKG